MWRDLLYVISVTSYECNWLSDLVTWHDMTRSSQNYSSNFPLSLSCYCLEMNDFTCKTSKKLNCRQVDALKGCLRYKKQHLLITNFNFHKQIWNLLAKLLPLHCIGLHFTFVVSCFVICLHRAGREREGGRRDGGTEADRESHLMSPGETLSTIAASDQTTNNTKRLSSIISW